MEAYKPATKAITPGSKPSTVLSKVLRTGSRVFRSSATAGILLRSARMGLTVSETSYNFR